MKVSVDVEKNRRKNHEADFDEVFENVPSAIIITDPAGNPVEWNQKAQQLFGKIPTVPLKDWPEKFGLFTDIGSTHCPAWDLPLSDALNGDLPQTGVEIYVQNPGVPGKWISMTARPLWTGDGKIRGALVLIEVLPLPESNSDLKGDQDRQNRAAYAFTEEIAKLGDDPASILNTAVVFATRMIGDGCAATLLNISRDRLRMITFYHAKPAARRLLRGAVPTDEFGLDESIENVIRSGEPLMIPVINENALLSQTQPEAHDYIREIGVRSILIVPIKGHNGVLGILTLFRDRGGHSYTVDDQSLAMDMAYRLGLAIENDVLSNSLRAESNGRISAEKALEVSEVRFRSVFTSTSLGIKIMDLDGNLLLTNQAFQKMLGYSAADLFGKSIFDFIYPADEPGLMHLLQRLKNEEVQNQQIEHRLVAKDGSVIWANAAFSYIKPQEGKDSSPFIVAIAEDISMRKRMEAEMAEMKGRMDSHIELERLHLAQELHDGPLQDLYSAIYRIENWGEAGAKIDRDKVETLKQDLLKVVQGLRNTAKDLRPQALTSFGLEKAIRSHVEEFLENHTELNIHLNLAQDKQDLSEETRLILFRIYQNSLANVLRHAHASDLFINFTIDAEEARLEIKDNGIGFVLPDSWVELVRQGHFGLAGAVERMAVLGGTFMVDSKPGQGTLVKAVIPIHENTNGSGKDDAEVEV